jgi:ribonuclease T2
MSISGRKHIFAAAVLGLMAFASLASGVAQAAGNDCILDNCADQKPPTAAAPQTPSAPTEPTNDSASSAPPSFNNGYRPRPSGASQPGDFDFYVFSLSWSPGFCAGDDKGRSQCAVGANLGFVVHGLWPQYNHGFPSDCGPSGRYPSRIALQSVEGLFPDEGLARYEWRKHGTCSGKSPADYFADVRRAHDTVKIPSQFLSANREQSWTPIDIERAFIAANPRLRPGMLAVACQHGNLEEVRICFSKDLRDFQICPEVARSGCRLGNVSVPPMR